MRKSLPRLLDALHRRHAVRPPRRGRLEPPLCHVHQGDLNGSGLTEPVFDEMKILKQLTNDKNPQVRLRAVDLLMSWQQKKQSCATCAARAAHDEELLKCLDTADDAAKERAQAPMHEALVLLGLREP